MRPGIFDAEWMIKVVLAQANPQLLRMAVVDMVGVIFERDDNDEELSVEEMVDRLVQVAVTGGYHPGGHAEEDYEEVFNTDDGFTEKLTREQQTILDKFKRILYGEGKDDEPTA